MGRRGRELGTSGWVNAGLGFNVYSGQCFEQPVREGEVKAPGGMYALGDAPLSIGAWGTDTTLRLGGAADYNAFQADNVTVEKTAHSEVFNMLLADSHAESVRTSVLLGTNTVYRSRWDHDNLP